MYTLASISTPTTMLDTHSKIIAMSFQGKDFTPAMKQLVMNLKLHFDEERKHSQEVSTRNPTLRTARASILGKSRTRKLWPSIVTMGTPSRPKLRNRVGNPSIVLP